MIDNKKLNIDAGIVLFNPDIRKLRANINSIINQVSHLVLFDNGSLNNKAIKKIINNYSNIIFLQSSHNLGIATALNKIFKYSHKYLNADYILTLDQDSVCPKNLIDEYLKHYNTNIAIYTPLIKDINAREILNRSLNKVDNVDNCITSGALTKYKAWSKVNGFDESMFIDCVDFDFCNRIRKKKYKILRVNDVALFHEIGHIKVYKTLFGKILIKNHNAFRKYYIARNTVYMARKTKKISKILVSYLRVVKQQLLVLFFEKNKLRKEKALFKGALDGRKVRILKKWC